MVKIVRYAYTGARGDVIRTALMSCGNRIYCMRDVLTFDGVFCKWTIVDDDKSTDGSYAPP